MNCYRNHPSFMEKELTSLRWVSFLKTNRSYISGFLLTNNKKVLEIGLGV